jgi:precorrin-8X/cobalt-precorrin-8 methylmutase
MRTMLGDEIERKSFEIIDRRIPVGIYSPQEYIIIRKIIHATADFSLRKNIFISKDAISLGLKKLSQHVDIYTDVAMVGAGISPKYLEGYGGKIIYTIREKETEEIAKKYKITRASASVMVALQKSKNIGIFAIGNAPTALFKVLELVEKKEINRDVLIIGACVGMVGAMEAKNQLIKSGLPCIVLKGKRGGSPIAATIINGLFSILETKGGVI